MSKSETRKRIVLAVRSLHEEVGPAATTIKGIAERAGVQRLTVYRHFPDDRALIGACSADWAEDHPLPDPAMWTGIEDPARRVLTALEALYGYFREGRPMLDQVLRDERELPELEEVMAPWWDYMREVAAGLAAGWGVAPESQRVLRSAVGHAIAFTTWASLTGEGLDDARAADVMVRWIEELADPCERDARASARSTADG